MPLAFESTTHGRIAFGFFNIETDLLILEEIFFFASDFCGLVEAMAGPGDDSLRLDGYRIRDRSRLGNLHGAIAGVDLSGFIGRVYKRFPFPQDPAGFKQQPEGDSTRTEMEALLTDWTEPEEIKVVVDPDSRQVAVAEYAFYLAEFYRLIEYVWLGGMPRWREMTRPGYVDRMARRVNQARTGLLRGLNLGE